MAKTMKVAVVRAFGEPLTIDEVPVPTPARGEVLVKVVASGVCHTGLHAAEGKVRAHIHQAPLEDVNRVLQDLKAGTIDGRIVLRLA